jgi:hypothetical protein
MIIVVVVRITSIVLDVFYVLNGLGYLGVRLFHADLPS